MSFCFCASWFFQNYFYGYLDGKLSSVGLNHRMFSPLLDIDHNCCNLKEALMWTQAHLSLWWSRLCSSWCLFHRHCVLFKSSAGAFKLVWVMKAGNSWSPEGLCDSDRSASDLVHVCGSFLNSTLTVFFSPLMSVTRWTLHLSSGRWQRLAFSLRSDTTVTIDTRCHSPPFTVTMQQRAKTPKHGGNPGRSGPHSTLFQGLIAGICCAPTAHTRRWTREQNKVTERWRQRFKLRCLPSQS